MPKGNAPPKQVKRKPSVHEVSPKLDEKSTSSTESWQKYSPKGKPTKRASLESDFKHDTEYNSDAASSHGSFNSDAASTHGSEHSAKDYVPNLSHVDNVNQVHIPPQQSNHNPPRMMIVPHILRHGNIGGNNGNGNNDQTNHGPPPQLHLLTDPEVSPPLTFGSPQLHPPKAGPSGLALPQSITSGGSPIAALPEKLKKKANNKKKPNNNNNNNKKIINKKGKVNKKQKKSKFKTKNAKYEGFADYMDYGGYGGYQEYEDYGDYDLDYYYKQFGDYYYDGYDGYQQYEDYGDYGAIAKANMLDADSYYYGELGDTYYYNDGEYGVYDDGLDYYYYTLRKNRGLNRNRYERRKLLEFGQNEGFMENSSSWTLTAVFVVGFTMVLLCIIGGIIYHRRRAKKTGYNTVKMSDIKVVAVSRDEESGGSSNEADAIKMYDS